MKLPSGAVASLDRMPDRVRVARLAAKLSQARLAQIANVTPSASAQWEHPRGTRPSIASIQSIAAATGVSVEWLVTGTGPHSPKRQTKSSDDVPAIDLETFARNVAEETLLQYFREMSAKSRNLLLMLASALNSNRRRSR